jgi:regulator of sirC expression with transglutaminase-like and TPR domain
VALLAAEEQPGVSEESVLAALDALAAPLHVRAGASPFEAVARLNHHLFSNLGFQGDSEDYYAPENSFLDKVIAQRKGLPIALSVIYVEVARRAGVPMDGVGFPGHFLVGTRATEDEPRFFVDPFHAGRIHTRDDLIERLRDMKAPAHQRSALLSASSPKQILLRMTYNLKGSYLTRRSLPDALRQIDRILALAPERREEHRDRGLLLAEAGRAEEALGSLRTYLELEPGADDADIIGEVIAQLEQA